MTILNKCCLALLLAAACLSGAINAHEYQQGTIKIAHPWSRPTPPKASMGVVYMRIENSGKSADSLLSVSCECAKSAEMHRSETDASGKSSMRQQTQVEVPAGGSAEFEPGGLHVMLMGLKAGLSEGNKFPVTLEFAKAGKFIVDVHVESRPPSDSTAADAHHALDSHKHH